MDKQDIRTDSVAPKVNSQTSTLENIIFNAKTLEKSSNPDVRINHGDSNHPEKIIAASESTSLPDVDQDSLLAKSEEKAFNDPSIGNAEIERLERQQDIEKKRRENEHLTQKSKSLEADTEIKKWIAEQTFGFMICWCCFVGLMTIIYFAVKVQNIEKEVIITLLGSTTISVVGLVGFIVKGLFGTKEDKQSKDNEKK